MSRSPKVSICLPNLNKDQTQIEVIDDASPNGAPTEFIRKVAGERVTVHCEPRNLGLAGIWNRCIGNCEIPCDQTFYICRRWRE